MDFSDGELSTAAVSSEQAEFDVDNLAHFNRPVPSAWDGLVVRAEASLHEGIPYENQREAAECTLEAVVELGHDERAHNRYYGLGLVGCSIPKRLMTPTRKRILLTEERVCWQ